MTASSFAVIKNDERIQMFLELTGKYLAECPCVMTGEWGITPRRSNSHWQGSR